MGLGESFQSHLRSYLKPLRLIGGEESSSCSKVSGHSAGWAAALISYFIIPAYGWQIALLITAIPAFYALYLRIALPDSPKYEKLAQERKPTIMENVKSVWSRKYARPTAMLWIVWFCVVFSYYGMFLWCRASW